MDYCNKSKRLVSVGQGMRGICLWDVAGDGESVTSCLQAKLVTLSTVGTLTRRQIDSPAMYIEPRFVAFASQGEGSRLLVGYFDRMLMYVAFCTRHSVLSIFIGIILR